MQARYLSVGSYLGSGGDAEGAKGRAIVTGAAGFVGGHLAHRLIQQGWTVLALDNLFNGRREFIPAEASFECIDLGTADEHRVLSLVRHFDADLLVHLASIHYIPYCLEHLAETFRSNVRSTDVLIRALTKSKPCKFILASSADVYDTSEQDHSETEPVCPRNPYGLSKALSEQILENGCRTNAQISGTVLRFFNIYGPRDTTPHILPRTIELISNSRSSEIRLGYLGGSRDFVHVADVVEAILASIHKARGGFEVFNVGTGISTGIRQAVEMVRALTGDDRRVVEVQSQFRSFDRKSLSADIRKITSQLGWRPRVAFDEGLQELLFGRNIPFAHSAD